MLKKGKIAIVYDWIDKWGGVERVLLTLQEMFPKADFFTSYFDKEKAVWAKDLSIKTSFLQQLPVFLKGSRLASFPFYLYAFESFNFSGYDLVISVSSSFAKSVITRPETKHICYLLTPTRYFWVSPEDYIRNIYIRYALSPYLTKLRNWDFMAARRPDKIISISRTVSERCKKYYQRKSEVVYPPFDLEYWLKIKSKLQSSNYKANLRQKYFLVVSRLEPYKKIDLVIKTMEKLKQNLVIVGEGSESAGLKKMAGDKVTFLAKVTDEELGSLYQNAEALIMPQEEDFGYVSLEAQFFNCPVVAFNKGGAGETVIDGRTGLFFKEQTVSSIQGAIAQYNVVKYELRNYLKKEGSLNIAGFSKVNFFKKFADSISEV